MSEAYELELRDITKRFGDTLANDHVSFCVRRGEVHALIGENGAGKSTLMNILYGMLRPDAGEILSRFPCAPRAMRLQRASAWCISISCSPRR